MPIQIVARLLCGLKKTAIGEQVLRSHRALTFFQTTMACFMAIVPRRFCYTHTARCDVAVAAVARDVFESRLVVVRGLAIKGASGTRNT